MKAEVKPSIIYLRPETEEEEKIADAIFKDGVAQVVGGGSEFTLINPSKYGRTVLLLEPVEMAVLAYALGASGAAFTGSPILSRLVNKIVNFRK